MRLQQAASHPTMQMAGVNPHDLQEKYYYWDPRLKKQVAANDLWAAVERIDTDRHRSYDDGIDNPSSIKHTRVPNGDPPSASGTNDEDEEFVTIGRDGNNVFAVVDEEEILILHSDLGREPEALDMMDEALYLPTSPLTVNEDDEDVDPPTDEVDDDYVQVDRPPVVTDDDEYEMVDAVHDTITSLNNISLHTDDDWHDKWKAACLKLEEMTGRELSEEFKKMAEGPMPLRGGGPELSGNVCFMATDSYGSKSSVPMLKSYLEDITGWFAMVAIYGDGYNPEEHGRCMECV